LRVAIIGATGVLGRHTVPRLIEAGHQVCALVRNEESRRQLQHLGAATFVGDILERATLAPVLEGSDVVLHLATAVPRPGQAIDWSQNDRIRREGTQHLVEACKAGGIRRYLQQSIAMLQCLPGDQWASESGTPWLNAITQSAWDMEEIVRSSGLDWLILRGGLFYGPGTGREEAWRRAARAGTLMLPEDGRSFLSLIHVADMADAFVRGLERASCAILAIVDDRPLRYSELFSHIAMLEAAPPPQSGAKPVLASFRVSNQAAKTALGWKPHYPSILSGLAS
jgi:nucleoside-diphosphate-sugar epimerase